MADILKFNPESVTPEDIISQLVMEEGIIDSLVVVVKYKDDVQTSLMATDMPLAQIHWRLELAKQAILDLTYGG